MTPVREALRSCPFCGSKMVAQGATAQKTISVWCMECGTRGPDVPFPDFCEPVAQIELCHQRWNTRTSAAPGEPCAVKSLKWGPYPNPAFAGPDVAVASLDIFGGHHYQVQRNPNARGYMAYLAPDFDTLFWKSEGHENVEAAKAAAQADYEQRIRSALVATPQPDAGWDEAITTALHVAKQNGATTHPKVKALRREAPAPAEGVTVELEPWRDELSEIVGHLGAAIVQSCAKDDQIIMDHVKAAHEIAKIVRRKA